ncbi:aldehyde dehydrogenase family 2 member C4-like isoform X2 [Carya illinoinensis]|uniref:aldehyde dehydrogenase family 2 member C4-like isoform X2 n=1 Tax=Carya illinoinensis TaxID=32201 RepID=UPI001C722CDB|nr:aldehyde dehydrogenase family 2 member C4-like isoform X2 [Carya illinoinensis]
MGSHSDDSSASFVKNPTIKFTKLFINGEFVDSVSGKTFETIDPRTGKVTARIAEGDKEDVELAVKAARQAFDHGPWPRLPGSERGRIMMKFADLLEENAEELAALDTIDCGKLFSVGKAMDIPYAANALRYYAGAADKVHGDVLKMSRELHGYTLLEPIGVVGHIIPWNNPIFVFFMKVSPTLAAGCTMVVKPAEQTPLSALYHAHLAKLAGIPDGVLNVITGFGPTAGAAISSHMDIDAGEACVASSRVYVQEGIYDEFVKKLVEKARAWIVGDPFDPKAQQGPQVDLKQFEKILSYIEHGKREGATLLTGGKPVADQKGYYIEPTIFADVKEEMLIAKDEIFGPVMALAQFKTIEEAIKRANSTRYGLAAGIVTKDLNVANTVSRSVRAGTIWISCYFALDNDCPFGGYKMSGFGKDFGLEALHKYLQVKSVVTPLYNTPWL